jgi:hypothetical protein
MRKIIITSLLLLIISCNPSFAIGLSLGASIGYAAINDPNYKDIDSGGYSGTLGIGLSQLINKDYLVAIQTTRFINKSSKKRVINKGGAVLDSKSYIESDSLLAAKIIDRFFYGIVLSNTVVEKSISCQGSVVGKSRSHSILYGASVGYLLTKNIATSLTYIAPNKELDLEGALFTNINYFF